jgi:hypothetical protein
MFLLITMQQEVEKVEDEVVALASECNDMLERLQTTRTNASKIIEQTQVLSHSRYELVTLIRLEANWCGALADECCCLHGTVLPTLPRNSCWPTS